MTLRLVDFEGLWRLSRRIDDRRAGRQGQLAGEAWFLPDAQGLTCLEEGVLSFPGHEPLTARQKYLWRAASGLIDVAFGDGRPFHSFDPAVPVATARHDCAPDLYRVSYDFAAWPDWAATWRVTGPRKDYTMVSRFRRAQDDASGPASARAGTA